MNSTGMNSNGCINKASQLSLLNTSNTNSITVSSRKITQSHAWKALRKGNQSVKSWKKSKKWSNAVGEKLKWGIHQNRIDTAVRKSVNSITTPRSFLVHGGNKGHKSVRANIRETNWSWGASNPSSFFHSSMKKSGKFTS